MIAARIAEASIIADVSRRPVGAATLRLSLCTLALAAASEAAAAPFDFLFGGPPAMSQAPRSRHRALRPASAVPLPPPRPHFPSDPPGADVAAGETQAFPSTPPTVPVPETPPAASSSPPLPPPKPAEIETLSASPPAGAPAGPTAPRQPEKILPDPDSAPKSTGPIPPLPPPKPAEIEKPATSRPATTETAKPAETKPAPAGRPPSAAPAPASPGTTSKPPEVAKPPAVAPSGATTAFTPRAPEDNPQCPSQLGAHHVDAAAATLGPQPDARCTVVEPVRLTGMTLADGAKVAFPDSPTIACTTAESFTAFVRDLLVPLAKGTFGSPVTAVWTGPGLECRSRDSIFGAKLSAHGQGLAIDIAQLKLADGRLIEVGTPKTDAETGFETAARAGACGYFHTVLGPGSDSYHRTHWHFDLEVRGAHGDSKYCK